MKLTPLLLLPFVAVLTQWPAAAQNAPDVRALLARAKAGQTVVLPAGTFAVGDVVVPAGVTLRGAGYGKTTLDASKFTDGLIIKGDKINVADLEIRGARVNGIKVEGAQNARIARVKLSGNLTGILMQNARGARAENLIVSENRTGAALTRCEKSVLVNCTLAGNSALGLSLAQLKNCVVFNNALVNNPTGVYLGEKCENLALDHNLYLASYTGKKAGEVARKSVQSWRDLSSHDARSVALPVSFAANSFRPVSSLSWNPARATTSDWGANALAGFAAPAADIDGKKRVGATDVGAFEVALTAPRAADGSFKVTTSQGTVSAGLFDRDGTEIAFLFQNLPLAAGTYPFWLPARDFQGRAIGAGEYQLRVAQSDLKLKYLGLAFNDGLSNRPEDASSFTAQKLVFDGKDRLILAQGWSENHLNVRAFDANFEKSRWTLPGSSDTRGAAVKGADVFVLRKYDKNLLGLVKLDSESGQIREIGKGQFSRTFPGVFTDAADGMAALGETLYVADPAQNKLFTATANDPNFAQSLAIASPSRPTADTKNNLIWLISDGKVVALDARGALVKTLDVAAPVALDANNGRLAVASAQTGKIEIFDLSDPARPQPILSIGRGDSPYNAFASDRFLFKTENGRAATRVDLALNSQGEVAVLDGFRTLFFDATGAIKRQQTSVWGQHLTSGKFVGDANPRFFSMGGDYAITFDARSRTWKPDGFYSIDPSLAEGRAPVGYFNAGGKNFGVYRRVVSGNTQLVVLRFEGYIGKMVEAFYLTPAGLVRQSDENGDGQLDKTTPVLGADGQPFKAAIMGDPRFMRLLPDGSLRMNFAADAATGGFVVPMRGLDAEGVPIYDWAGRRALKMVAETDASFVSPYDFKTTEQLIGADSDLDFWSDGAYAATVNLQTSGGVGLANNFGTDMAGFSRDGQLQWFHPLNWTGGVGGVQIAGDVLLTNRGTEMEFIAMGRDGLGLGVLGPAQNTRWNGWWVDHPEQFSAFVGDDGKPYVVVGDYVLNSFHWFALEGADKVRRSRETVTISPPKARLLAALQPLVPTPPAQPPTAKVSIPALKAPLPIDGDRKKWREAGITPQILITPETASANIKGPLDKSAIVRLAHQGGDLYVQILAFDDVVTMHQPLALHYKQDAVELAINGFMSGFKFDVARTTDEGDVVLRERFANASFTLLLDATQAPRSITILDDARDVPERALIESIYGVDLSRSKVIVTEWKLPLQAAFKGDEKNGPTGKSGDQFYLGFSIDDNDVAGSDLQKYMVWPATYNTFAPREAGALATLE